MKTRQNKYIQPANYSIQYILRTTGSSWQSNCYDSAHSLLWPGINPGSGTKIS